MLFGSEELKQQATKKKLQLSAIWNVLVFVINKQYYSLLTKTSYLCKRNLFML